MQINEIELDAIVFDLGGVILNIDYQLTIKAFEALGFKTFNEQYSKMQQSGLFDKLEKGLIGEAEFVATIKQDIPTATDQEIINAWNALILDFPIERLNLLVNLKSEVDIYLLSNTNEIHLKAFNQVLKNEFELDSLESEFNKLYLSHEIHARKPEAAAFEIILKENKLSADRVLFIDDSPQHIEAAKKLGLHTIHIDGSNSIEELFTAFLA
jgi:HAD superfamily hydrolase (TIGR01509 family)